MTDVSPSLMSRPSKKMALRGSRCLTSISVVIPAYNEQENLPLMIEALLAKLTRFAKKEIIVVDDGSRDATAKRLRESAARHPEVKFILFSRNFGHQAAIRAGAKFASGQAIVMMDADFQHPVALIERMVEMWEQGTDIIQTQRLDNKDGSLFKHVTSAGFYWLINFLSDAAIVPGTADFRLLDRKVVDTLNSMQESDMVFRTTLPWLGFKTELLPFSADQRLHGNTKYSVRKMTRFAVSGIVSSSIAPLRLSILLAAGLSGAVAVYCLYALVKYFVSGDTVPGWASLVITICIIGSLQLLVLGVIGEYVGRVFRETRRRPSFIIQDSNISAGKVTPSKKRARVSR